MPDVTTSLNIVEPESFKRSTAAVVRSLANDAKLDPELHDTCHAVQLGLASPVSADEALQVPVLRALGDVVALVGAHHDAVLHKQLQPRQSRACQLFNALELARCESLGARQYAGVSTNIKQLLEQEHTARNIKTYTGMQQLQLVLGCLLRERLMGACAPAGASVLVEYWRPALTQKSGELFELLQQQATNQASFAALALQLIDAIDVRSVLGDNADDVATQADVLVASDSSEVDQDDAGDEELADKPVDEIDTDALMPMQRDDSEEQSEAAADTSEDIDEMGASDPNRDAPVSSESDATGSAEQISGSGYAAYATEFDEVVKASELATSAELDVLRAKLDEQIQRYASLVGRLSGRLQRVLMSEQQRHWQFDLDEGMLDTARLTRVVTQPMASLTFKQESDIQFRDTTVTILVDNSKSMLGKPITIAAACTDILARTLERCGVSVEVLGFTTTELSGGDIFNKWNNEGRAANPGRLNALRHIIYKSADTPYRSARKALGLMLRSDILKQNVDGEALQWAHKRLVRRSQQRKLLMVISDGAPIDTSTLAVNPANLLVDHLHSVIHSIEKQSEVELVAIGIGHDVSQYYSRSINIFDVKHLGKAMLKQVTALIKRKGG